ncbi:peptidoglycan endopeptidase LytF [Winogradskyella sediminis]|nr:peptidoglycan endopeptidase LytF [Winogradskyella sediminis]
MLKSFKLILTFLISFTSLMAVNAQDEVKFKDVVLDGKPAKLDIRTGEITLVTLEQNNVTSEMDSVNTDSISIPKLSINKEEPDVTNVILDNVSDFHVVQKGDNLFQLSIKYKTSLGELQEANNLETTLITTGQRLRVRNFTKVNNDAKDVTFWVVKKGDTLYSIAKDKGTTVKALMRMNGLKSDVIKIGQKLQLK